MFSAALHRFVSGRILRLVCALLLTSIGAVRADTIAVPGFSFETPDTGYVSINIDWWEKVAKPSWYQETGVYKWAQLTGLFENTEGSSFDHIDNLNGTQALWLFAVPEVALYQDYDTKDWNDTVATHAFNAKFEVGKAYTLTVGVAGYGGGMLDGVQLQLALYYRGTSGQMIVVSSIVVENNFDVFPDNYHLLDFQVRVPAVKPTDGWANKNIGIRFLSLATQANQGGYWDIDNVRLTSDVPPPPVKLGITGTDMKVSWAAATAWKYQVETSTDLVNWAPSGAAMTGAGAELSKLFPLADFPERYFRVALTPPP